MSPHDDANRALIELLRAELPKPVVSRPTPASAPQVERPSTPRSAAEVISQPGRPFPSDPQTTTERTLYHAPRTSGAMGTMTREGATWPCNSG